MEADEGGQEVVAFGGLTLQVEAGRAGWRGRSIALGERECLVLRRLIEAQGNVVSPTDLQDAAWPDDRGNHVARVRGVVRRLRRKFQPSSCIETIGSEGYRLAVGDKAKGDSNGSATSGERSLNNERHHG